MLSNTSDAKFEGILKDIGTVEPTALLVGSQAYKFTEVRLCKSVSGGHKTQRSCRNCIDTFGEL